MSADNGIYIHKFKEGWKVIHGQAVENAVSEEDMREFFEGFKVYKRKFNAYQQAIRLLEANKEYGVEYGIQEI